MKKTLKRVEAIKIIRRQTISLARAIEVYNYLTCYGEIEITEETINNFFNI